MDFQEKLPSLDAEEFQKDLVYLGITLLLVGAVVGVSNITKPDDAVRVGMVEVHSDCVGLDAGVCLGIQKRDHETFNYVNWTDAEPGTANYYRRIEAELMIRAYNVCEKGMNGMEWTSEVSYKNKTAQEWSQNENVTLLPCESTFYRPLK